MQRCHKLHSDISRYEKLLSKATDANEKADVFSQIIEWKIELSEIESYQKQSELWSAQMQLKLNESLVLPDPAATKILQRSRLRETQQTINDLKAILPAYRSRVLANRICRGWLQLRQADNPELPTELKTIVGYEFEQLEAMLRALSDTDLTKLHELVSGTISTITREANWRLLKDKLYSIICPRCKGTTDMSRIDLDWVPERVETSCCGYELDLDSKLTFTFAYEDPYSGRLQEVIL